MLDLAPCKLSPLIPQHNSDRAAAKNGSRPVWGEVAITADEVASTYSGPIKNILMGQNELELVVLGKPKFGELDKIRREFRSRHSNSQEIENTYASVFAPKRNSNLVDMNSLSGMTRVNHLYAKHDSAALSNRPLQENSVIVLTEGATRGDVLFGLMSERVLRKTFPELLCGSHGHTESQVNFTNNQISSSGTLLKLMLRSDVKLDEKTKNQYWIDYCNANALEMRVQGTLTFEPIMDLLANRKSLKLSASDLDSLKIRGEKYLARLSEEVADFKDKLQKANCPPSVMKESFQDLDELISTTRKWIEKVPRENHESNFKRFFQFLR